VQEGQAEHGWFDMSTLKEPYRLQGKKTMGLELAGAFAELQALGWIDAHRPRMVVQAEGCAPIVKAFMEGASDAPLWPNAQTLASGLRVPKAFADFLILQAVRDSSGTAVAISDEQMAQAQRQLAASDGVFACPKGAATLAALQQLYQKDWSPSHERVVLFNTGSGSKYAELLHATPPYWPGQARQ
jgi:threonine synthase